jgi:hypothetical protein
VGAPVWGGAGAPLPEPLHTPEDRDANAIVDDLVRVRRKRLLLRAEQDDLADRITALAKVDRGLALIERRGEDALERLISSLTVPRLEPPAADLPSPQPPDHGEQ